MASHLTALALQLGFVEPLIDWLHQTVDGPVVIDQHPAVIGLVYAELWYRDGLLGDKAFMHMLDAVRTRAL